MVRQGRKFRISSLNFHPKISKTLRKALNEEKKKYCRYKKNDDWKYIWLINKCRKIIFRGCFTRISIQRVNYFQWIVRVKRVRRNRKEEDKWTSTYFFFFFRLKRKIRSELPGNSYRNQRWDEQSDSEGIRGKSEFPRPSPSSDTV